MRTTTVLEPAGAPARGRRGFTILELLVVMGIMVVLLGILLPTITRIRNMSKSIRCEANIRTLTQACLAFAVDNDNRLPGSTGSWNSAIPSQQDFLFGNNAGNASNLYLAPQTGTLFPYVNRKAGTYLCPSLASFAGDGGSGTASAASNGRFDYAIFGVWTGARVSTVDPTARMYYPDGHYVVLSTPVVVQESPNQFNGPNMEGCHSNIDLLAKTHFGGSYYGAIDGSVQFVIESASNPNYSNNPGCWVWTSRAPSGQWATMGTSSPPWAWWDTQ